MLGICYSGKLRERETICSELISLCDLLLIDISTVKTPITLLLKNLLAQERFSHLDFISIENVVHKIPVSSCLSKEDNTAVSDFMFSLGKYDTKTQIQSIHSFKQYIEFSKSSYHDNFKSKAKVCVCFSISFGIILSLVLV